MHNSYGTVKYFEYYTEFSFFFKYEYTNEKIIVCYFSFSDGKMLISVNIYLKMLIYSTYWLLLMIVSLSFYLKIL